MTSRRPPHRLAVFALLTVSTLGAAALADDPAEEPRIVPAPPAWDAQAAALFSSRGVAVPRTVMTAETGAPLDLAWIQRALGFAETLDEKDVARLGGEEGDEEGGEGRGGRAMASEPADDAAPPPSPTPRGESRRDEQGPPAPRPARPTASAPANDAPAGGAAPAERRSRGAARESAEESDQARALDGKAKKDEASDAPQPVLSKVEAQARLGKVLVESARGGHDAMAPRAQRVTAFVDGPRIRVVVDLVFENPTSQRLEGTFYYPLPDGASPAAFGMFPGSPPAASGVATAADGRALGAAALLPPLPGVEQLAGAATDLGAVATSKAERLDWAPMQQARVVEQKRARQVYEEVVRGRVDPALMEWSGGNTFKARVFPLEPRALKRVVLAYEQTLTLTGDAMRWVLPLPGERSLGDVPVDVLLGAGLEVAPGAKDEPGVYRAMKQTGGHGPRRLLHLDVPAGAEGVIDLPLVATAPHTTRGLAISGLVSSGGDDLGRAFYARVAPDVPEVETKVPTERAVFVVDTSLSEEGLRRSLAGELLLAVLERDPTITEYAVLLFDVRARWLHAPGWRQNSAAARAETRAELEAVYLEGATNLGAALEELERQASWIDAGPPDRPQAPAATRFLLSDGLVTWGQDKVEPLLDARAAALKGRWITYRIGDAPTNRDLYDALSRRTAGRTVNVLAADQVAAAARAHRLAPVTLKGVSVDGATGVDLVVAGEPRLVFPGQELEVGGRLTGERERGAVTLAVDLDVGGELRRTTVVLNGLESPLAGRAWAELWTRKLLALDDERLDRMVVALSQTFGLANTAASLLILESEADWTRFDLKKETVDLADLERLRAAEEDQRRDRLQGIALDEVAQRGKDVVRALRDHKAPATQPALPLLDRPLAGGLPRLEAEVAYRRGRTKDALDPTVFDAVARARAAAGDTFGAIRALSCLVEQHPREAEANRLVGYACLALGQYDVAAELFERVRLNRPFEPQSYLEEAMALEAAGRWADAARDFEVLLAKAFPRHDAECKVVAAYQYGRLLAGRLRDGDLAPATKELLAARLAELKATLSDPLEKRAMQLTIHWNTDSTDIDLWVVEPEGERCFYSNRDTKAGGKLFWDTTTGYGPELYRRMQGGRGTYDVLIHYFGNNSARLAVPTAVLLVRDRDAYGPEDGYTRRFQMRLLPASQAVLRLRKETF